MSEDIPDGIKASDILEAIRDFDSGLKSRFKESTDYDLICDDKRYPPVAIMCLAARRVSGRELKPREDVRGGTGTKCFKIFQGLDFNIVSKKSKEYALIVAYYLSKFNEKAYGKLGFKTQIEAHNKIGKILGCNPKTIKNRRDDFDPLHPWRKGWHQVPLSKKKIRVAELFQNLEEIELRQVVNCCLQEGTTEIPESLEEIASSLEEQDDERKDSKTVFSPQRAETGLNAENYFIECFHQHKTSFSGEILDTRLKGCGYDFEIGKGEESVVVEVKGLEGEKGGISFTSKEWEVAELKRDKYFLAIVRNASRESDTKIEFIQNPYTLFKPNQVVTRPIQIRWNISDRELRNTIQIM